MVADTNRSCLRSSLWGRAKSSSLEIVVQRDPEKALRVDEPRDTTGSFLVGEAGGADSLQRVGEQESQEQGDSLVQGGESKPVPDRSAGVSPLGWVTPGDRSLHCQQLFSRVQGDLQRGSGRQRLGKLKQEPAAADIARASRKGRTLPILSPARHGDIQGQPGPGVADPPLGLEESPEGLSLIGGNLDEHNAVRDAPRRRVRFPGPDHPRLHLDGALFRLKAEADRILGLKAVGQLETRTRFAEIPGPTHSRADRRARLGPMHQREVNGVPEVASGVRTAGQVMHSIS